MTIRMYLLCNQIGLTTRTAGKDELQLLFNVAAALGLASSLAAAAFPLPSAASPAASQPPATAWHPAATALEGHIYRAAHPCRALQHAADAS